MSNVEGLVTLQERMVNLVNQMTIPVVEVAIVIESHINQLLPKLIEFSQKNSIQLSPKITQRWDIDVENSAYSNSNFSIDKVLDIIDKDRMDIFSTLIRVTLNEVQLEYTDAILFLRSWEKLVREQLAQVSGPGQLFSPLEIPDGF
ncbi:MAG: hypothetical protein ACPGAN_02095 [Candidatus Poseidoniaceae archaeon]